MDLSPWTHRPGSGCWAGWLAGAAAWDVDYEISMECMSASPSLSLGLITICLETRRTNMNIMLGVTNFSVILIDVKARFSFLIAGGSGFVLSCLTKYAEGINLPLWFEGITRSTLFLRRKQVVCLLFEAKQFHGNNDCLPANMMFIELYSIENVQHDV